MRINIHRCPPDAYITAVRVRTYLDEAKLLSYGKKVATIGFAIIANPAVAARATLGGKDA